jgi:hypothetical protein
MTVERPVFLVTIDTEGDNIWSRPRRLETRNAEVLPRFQALCERYALRPTYLTNWEMAESPVFREFGRDVLARQTGEIGMHLHAWNSPPEWPLTEDDLAHLPYLIEYPEPVMREKVRILTDTLENVFGVDMVSHRAGRWAFDERYARALVAEGYRIDCSVTPHVSWRAHRGAPNGHGGTDYRLFPQTAYHIDPYDITRPGKPGALVEVPMTILRHGPGPAERMAYAGNCLLALLGRSPRRRGRPRWLRPNGRNRAEMLEILEVARNQGRDYVEFMLHSSEFLAGSPNFATTASIESLFDDLDVLFAAASTHFAGATLAEYAATWGFAREIGSGSPTGAAVVAS